MEVLVAMEKVRTDEEDCPQEEIKITATSVFSDPFQEAEEEVHVYAPPHLRSALIHTLHTHS